MLRTHVIARLADLKPGRRGFGGTDDAIEAAAFRRELQSDRELNPGMASPPSAELRPAAVLVPLIDHAHGMSVLLTQRTAHLTAHAGQISFPGGRIEEDDSDAIAAALRETEEEVGLPRDRVSVVGRLDTYLTGTGFEITPAAVIGFLTILGFSLYDTVVVFDKIRENTTLDADGAARTFGESVNLAVNQTLVRSINTGVVAALPVAAILFFGAFVLGADTLRDISLALLVGILVGTYSTIFVAAPLYANFRHNEPRIAKHDKRVLQARERAQGSEAADGEQTEADAPLAR
jgi:8-oxo-dGTP pyrophosphatase MutT (NUDIX family)